eukprot:6174766-Pleurochrysis_carterae.AAC.3
MRCGSNCAAVCRLNNCAALRRWGTALHCAAWPARGTAPQVKEQLNHVAAMKQLLEPDLHQQASLR